jgi:hypothetical protein
MIGTTEMCRLAGCSFRQLDYWCRLDVVRPVVEARGSGNGRRFGERQVRNIRMITDLARLGAQCGVLRRVNEIASLIPEDSWTGTAFVDMSGELHLAPPNVPSWAIDLARCAHPGLAPVQQLSLV